MGKGGRTQAWLFGLVFFVRTAIRSMHGIGGLNKAKGVPAICRSGRCPATRLSALALRASLN
jgi:hypothetical protein